MRKTIAELAEEAREALKPIFADATAEELSTVVFGLGALGCGFRELAAPDAKGWWARRRDGRTEWFEVVEIQSEPRRFCLMIWIAAIEDFVDVPDFCGVDVQWFGPFALPWEAP